MAHKVNNTGILISAVLLIISVLLLIDRLFATGPVQLILEDGRAVPVEGASYFTLYEALFFIITAWVGGMSFLYIILFSRENGTHIIKSESKVPEDKSTTLLAANILMGDERILFQNIVGYDGILQRELILKTGFSEPKVSRLLDKIERRDLIIRQRDGMGNRIFLKKR